MLTREQVIQLLSALDPDTRVVPVRVGETQENYYPVGQWVLLIGDVDVHWLTAERMARAKDWSAKAALVEITDCEA